MPAIALDFSEQLASCLQPLTDVAGGAKHPYVLEAVNQLLEDLATIE